MFGVAASAVAADIAKICAETTVSNVTLSISLGFATKTAQTQDIMAVVKQADDMMYKEKLSESRSIKSRAVNTILETLHAKNAGEGRYPFEADELLEGVGGLQGLDKSRIAHLKILFKVHDIGTIAVDTSILNKPGPLTDEEYAIVKRHTETGYHILNASPDFSFLADYVLAHHERWDGKGYPNGRAGTDIPLLSRILSVVDAYEAMVTDKPYRQALSQEEAVRELEANAGSQFDPQVVEAFLRVLPLQTQRANA